MRGVVIFFAVVSYLFSFVYIESELVKLEVKRENLHNRVTELENQRKALKFEVIEVSNLAQIEEEAKARGFIFPNQEDILGIVP